MFLLKNGDQIVCETFDGLMHKMNINLNTEYEILVSKKQELTWVMTNCKRDFLLANKEAHYVDYDLVDKIIHAVPIDTERHQSLYHNLIFKRLPANLRPLSLIAHKPSAANERQVTNLALINSSRVLWKMQSRSIYRPSDVWPHWLRNPSPINGSKFWLHQDKTLSSTESEMLKKLQVDFGLTYLPNEERFYKMFKISQKDLCYMLENAKDEKEREEIVFKRIYSVEETLHGRRGVMSLKESYDYLRKLEFKKDRVDDFMAKFGGAYGMSASQVRKQGGVHVLDELG